MENRIAKLSMYLFLAIIFFTGSDIYSQGRNRNFGRGMNDSNIAISNFPNLSNKQIGEIQNIREECLAKQEQDLNLLLEKNTILNTLIASGNSDKEAVKYMINELIIEINELQDKILKTRFITQTKIDALLIYEQNALSNNYLETGLILERGNGTGRGLGFGRGKGWGRGMNLRFSDGRLYRNRRW